MLPVLEKVHLVQPVDNRYKAILVWGGLRGAVTIVLAMVAAGNDKLPEDTREFIALSATLFVLFTLFVNATTLGLFMHALGLDKLSRLELALRDRVLALSKINVDRHLAQIIRRRNARIEGLAADPASAGEAEVEAVPAELALDLDERVKVGLVTLCTREKELYLEQFEQQILSRRMVAVLTADADRLIDSVRDKGVAGYEEWLVDISRPDLGFRLALWLHRRLGFERMLTERLADRFETLMVTQSVLAELAAFNISSVADLLGSDAEAALAAVIDNRQEAVDSAFKALSLQYPGYAESIETRQLERAAIRFESTEYNRRLREGIISREVYNDLREQLAERRGAISKRPPLDLGLELAKMIERVPLFASLDRPAVVELSKRLRAVVALPGEKIIRVGGPPDSMYFIAAGEVTVQAAELPGDPEGRRLRGRDGPDQRQPAQRRRGLRRLLPSAGACIARTSAPCSTSARPSAAKSRPWPPAASPRTRARRRRRRSDRRIMVFRTARVSRSLMIMSARGARAVRKSLNPECPRDISTPRGAPRPSAWRRARRGSGGRGARRAWRARAATSRSPSG